MSDLTPREHALKVAVLEAIAESAKSELAKARKAAEPEFAAIRADGGKQLAVMLPNGDEIGLISIKAGVPTVTADEDQLLAWAREHCPEAIEQHITDQALKDAEVIDMISACFPGMVQERLRSATREALLKEMAENGGKVHAESGEFFQLGEVENHKPTGAFILAGAGAQARRDRIVTEWQRGNLREIALGRLTPPGAVQAAAEAVAEPETAKSARTMPEPILSAFRDEHGFKDPEAAAAHARLIQGGFSTPPVEAYRMVHDGGVQKGRALVWMEKHGLDPNDPREGKDTPWPLAGPDLAVAS